MADSIGAALLIVLDRLDPAERLAFVLHDQRRLFLLTKSPQFLDARQRRPDSSQAERAVVFRDHQQFPRLAWRSNGRSSTRFFTALRTGDFEGLVAVLRPRRRSELGRSSRPSRNAERD